MDLKALSNPFPATDIEWRLQQAGKNTKGVWAKVLAYITNRAIMDRLDAVCGPENWKNEFRYEQGGAILCGLSVRIGEEWVTKWDGAEATDIEAVKGGLSNAMKRAGVQWGIGRYLYDLEEGWAEITEAGVHYAPANPKKELPAFRWNPPKLPSWALPKGEPEPKGDGVTVRVALTLKQRTKLYLKAAGDELAVHSWVAQFTGKPCTKDAWPPVSAEEYDKIVRAIETETKAGGTS